MIHSLLIWLNIFCMYYENESQSYSFVPTTNNSLIRYLGEGLQKNQLCVYLSMHNIIKDQAKNNTITNS